MGLVGQEPVLFNESIGANIAYGKEGQVTQEEIVAAAIAANAHGFISALSDGYVPPFTILSNCNAILNRLLICMISYNQF